jgi:lipoprotein-anchoring transpeptidase ErfK/SrfK
MPPASLMSIAVLIGNVLSDGVAAAPVAESTWSASEIRLEVTLSDRQLRVLQGEDLVRSYPVAIGTEKYPTPQGDFRISRVIWNPRWVPPESEWAEDETPKEPGDPGNPMGKVKIFFQEPDYYIHGTEAEESLGQAASHGCVRMANRDVVDLARLVMEHGGENRPPNWFKRIINFVRSTEEVRLSSPVPLSVVG